MLHIRIKGSEGGGKEYSNLSHPPHGFDYVRRHV